jgi:hypothetical protein
MKKFFIYTFMFLLSSSVSVLAAPMESENFRLEKTVVSSGGGFIASDSFEMNGTVGQSTPIGISSSASYMLMPGFCHQILLIIAKGDLNGDGATNLKDAILALKIFSNFQSLDVQRDADVNGDGSVGLEEVLFILQKVGSLR